MKKPKRTLLRFVLETLVVVLGGVTLLVETGSNLAFAQTSQPRPETKEFKRNARLAIQGMEAARLMNRTTTAGIAAIESTFEIYRKLCQDYDDLQGCSQLFYPTDEHPTRTKALQAKSISILKEKCEKFGFANEDGEFCYQYGSALSHAGHQTAAIEVFKKRCAATGGASGCMTIAFELSRLKPNAARSKEAHTFARRACEDDITECATALSYFSDGPDRRFFETQAERLCAISGQEFVNAERCNTLAQYKWKRGKEDEALRLFESSCKLGEPTSCTYVAAIFLARNNRLKARDSLREPCSDTRKIIFLPQREFFSRICPVLQAGRDLPAADSEYISTQLRGLASVRK